MNKRLRKIKKDFKRLLPQFSAALLEKLLANEVKYNWGDSWRKTDWEADLQKELVEHTAKGDPRDVAIYAFFAWYHKWSTAAPVLTEVNSSPAPLIYPDELTPALDEVLGWPNFRCGPLAHAFQAAGYPIPRKAEREQAFIHHWLIKLVLKHGDKWTEVASQELQALQDGLKAKEGGQADV